MEATVRRQERQLESVRKLLVADSDKFDRFFKGYLEDRIVREKEFKALFESEISERRNLDKDISVLKRKILPLEDFVSALEEKFSEQKTFITLLKHGDIPKMTEEEQIKLMNLKRKYLCGFEILLTDAASQRNGIDPTLLVSKITGLEESNLVLLEKVQLKQNKLLEINETIIKFIRDEYKRTH